MSRRMKAAVVREFGRPPATEEVVSDRLFAGNVQLNTALRPLAERNPLEV